MTEGRFVKLVIIHRRQVDNEPMDPINVRERYSYECR